MPDELRYYRVAKKAIAFVDVAARSEEEALKKAKDKDPEDQELWWDLCTGDEEVVDDIGPAEEFGQDED
jgi:hypothetical protein